MDLLVIGDHHIVQVKQTDHLGRWWTGEHRKVLELEGGEAADRR